LRTRTAELWVVGPSCYLLDLVERIILILELRDELWGRGILTENFLAGGRSRTAEAWVAGPASYPLDHEVLVERIILELPDELWGRGSFNSWVINRKYSKSKSLTLTLVGLELLLFVKLGSPLSRPLLNNNSGTSWWIVRPRIYLTGKFV
jgi:hypothetical protein